MLDQLVAHVRSQQARGSSEGAARAADAGPGPLSGVDVLLIQHQMGQHTAMLQAMFDLGLDPRRTWAVDIPYTAQDRVVDRMAQLGVPRAHIDRHQYVLAMGDYGAFQTARVSAALYRIGDAAKARGERRKLVILVRAAPGRCPRSSEGQPLSTVRGVCGCRAGRRSVLNWRTSVRRIAAGAH